MIQAQSMTVVGYCRVSRAEQAAGGVSMEAQAEKIRMYASLHDLDLIGIEADPGFSAKTLNRPGLRVALGRLESGEAKGLVVTKVDRLSRSVLDWSNLIGRFFDPKSDRQLFSVGDSIDTRSATGRMVINMMMTIAQWERETIAERVTGAHNFKRTRGEAVSAPAFGRKLGDGGKVLIDDPAEQAILAEMRDWHRSGRTLRSIADELNRRGVPTKRGGKCWTHVVVKRIVERKALGENAA